MPIYIVSVSQSLVWDLNIEAENEKNAKDLAIKMVSPEWDEPSYRSDLEVINVEDL